MEVRFRVCRVRDRELRISVCRGLGSGIGSSGRVCRGRVEWWRAGCVCV